MTLYMSWYGILFSPFQLRGSKKTSTTACYIFVASFYVYLVEMQRSTDGRIMFDGSDGRSACRPPPPQPQFSWYNVRGEGKGRKEGREVERERREGASDP